MYELIKTEKTFTNDKGETINYNCYTLTDGTITIKLKVPRDLQKYVNQYWLNLK